ncbi:hypothetical protein HDV05_004541 [Chytridiales sp. JEL 0842]|nr:hypothetical protein HDV05_004541 [Chytridiales sp. JEL 0842]
MQLAAEALLRRAADMDEKKGEGKPGESNNVPVNVKATTELGRDETMAHHHYQAVVITPTKTQGKKGKLKRLDIDEHLMSVAKVVERYGTDVSEKKPASSMGLHPTIAAERLASHGPNILPPPKRKSWVVKFIECLLSLFNIMLLLAGLATYVLFIWDPKENFQNSYIGGILVGVAFINAGIEFYQQYKNASIMGSFMSMVPLKCTVIRQGTSQQIPSADLVPGDVVCIRMGDKIPADLFLFSCTDLKVDNASLTGESEPQERSVDNVQKSLLDATNLCFSGTMAVSGEGYGIVIRTGDHTVLGQIAGLTTHEKKRSSPLSKEIERFCKIISFCAITTAAIFFLICILRTRNMNYSLSFAIGILVAWVPQGIPATVTMLLTIAAKRMASNQVLVKDLQGVETLGAITMLCTDKTGTLTRNQMTVTNLYTNGEMYIQGVPHPDENEKPMDLSAPGILEMVHISGLCSRARFDRIDVAVPNRRIIGDATESGLLRFISAQLPNIDALSSTFPKLFEIPFNSDTKTHISINVHPHSSGELMLYLKGAPERVLKQCSTILRNGVPVPLEPSHQQDFQASYERMAGKGHRVLAFAQLWLPGETYTPTSAFTKPQVQEMDLKSMGLCFVGLISLEDPPKHGVREAVGHLRMAGIKVVMVTGDHPLTAEC